jgi:hypothetical protein
VIYAVEELERYGDTETSVERKGAYEVNPACYEVAQLSQLLPEASERSQGMICNFFPLFCFKNPENLLVRF